MKKSFYEKCMYVCMILLNQSIIGSTRNTQGRPVFATTETQPMIMVFVAIEKQSSLGLFNVEGVVVQESIFGGQTTMPPENRIMTIKHFSTKCVRLEYRDRYEYFYSDGTVQKIFKDQLSRVVNGYISGNRIQWYN